MSNSTGAVDLVIGWDPEQIHNKLNFCTEVRNRVLNNILKVPDPRPCAKLRIQDGGQKYDFSLITIFWCV